MDIVRLQEVGFVGTDDPTVLEWTAHEGRILLTHDKKTIPFYAYERVRKHQPMPGVFEIAADMPIGQAIEEILLLAECSLEREWEGQIVYLPMK